MDFLDKVVFAGVSVRLLIGVVVGLVVLGAIIRLVASPKKSGGNHLIKRRCSACGWTGEVSQYNKKCPKCAKAIA